MKRRYQIDQQRAVQQFRRLATEQNPNIQMILPMADIVGLLQEGVGNLLRHAGLELMHLVMDIRRNFSGDWSLATEAAHEKVDANKVKFIVPLKPREKQTFSYELTTRNGVNVTR